MRYHPLTILYQIYQLIRNSIILALLLFVWKRGSDFWLFEYGRYIFVLSVLYQFLHIFFNWWTRKYEVKNQSFYLESGVWTKKNQTIPFSKVQNVRREKSFFHALLGLTSLTFETAMDGDDDSIVFEVLTKEQAAQLIDLVEVGEEKVEIAEEKVVEESSGVVKEMMDEDNELDNRTIHFQSSNKDLIKASFTSLSFLALIPILSGLYENLQPFLPDDEKVQGMLEKILNNQWFLLTVLILAVMISVVVGMLRTMIRYGKFEISSNDTHIFIQRGVLEETYFSIEKKKVQALEVKQTMLKRVFGLAEVKLISTAKTSDDGVEVDVNSLYPFLPIDKAMQLVSQILPSYTISTREMQKLPKMSLWMRIIRPSWLWIGTFIGLYFFKPSLFGVEEAWWIIAILVFLWLNASSVLDYYHTSFGVDKDQFQFRNGGFSTRLFISKRSKIIELTVSRNWLQRKWGMGSISTTNRSTPVHVETIDDLPQAFIKQFHQWYYERQKYVQYDRNESKRLEIWQLLDVEK